MNPHDDQIGPVLGSDPQDLDHEGMLDRVS
jgi:hypothetical protein